MPINYSTTKLLRLTPEQRQRWTRIARETNRSLSQWIRHCADLEADRHERNRETFGQSS
jgi:hypothetical protein